MKLFYSLLTLIVTASTAVAQAPYWQQTSGPFGGNVSSIVEDSSAALYALADNGIYRSTDNGTTWVRRSEISVNTTFIALTIARNGHYFASTANAGVYRSTDLGVTWAEVNNGMPQSFAWSIAANPLADEVIVATGPGIYRTTDDGETWALTGNERIARPVFFTPNGSAYAAVDSGLMRSTDPTRASWEWSDSAIAPSMISAMVAIGDDTIIAGSEENGLFFSTDAGATWAARTPSVVTDSSIMSLDRGIAGELFMSTSDGGLFRSTDGGATWAHWNAGNYQFTSESTHHSRSGRYFVATVKGMYYTDDDAVGVEWAPSRTGIINSVIRGIVVAQDGDVFALQFTGPFHRSTDGGATWSIIDLDIPPATDATALALDSSGRLHAAIRGVGLFRSADDGNSWTRYGESLPTTRLTAMAIDSLGRIFVGAENGNVYRTTDDGATWDEDAVAAVTSLSARGENVYVGTTSGLYVSRDGGRQYMQAGVSSPIYSVVITADRSAYAGSYSGRVYRSSDDGMNWQYSVTSPTAVVVTAVAVNARGDVFAGAQPGGTFVSRDGGATWTSIASGLVNPAITTITFDAGGIAYAGTYGGGVHRSAESTTSVTAERATRDASISVWSDGSLVLEIRRSSNVALEIFDLLGRRIAAHLLGELAPGTHRVQLGDLRPGTYVCLATIDGESMAVSFAAR